MCSIDGLISWAESFHQFWLLLPVAIVTIYTHDSNNIKNPSCFSQPNDPKQRKEYVDSILSRMTEYVVQVQKDCHNIITSPHVYGKDCVKLCDCMINVDS